MPISPARAAAFDILFRVERESSYASELLHSNLCKLLTRQDHALATELVMGVLRWRSRLDDEIAKHSSQPLPKLDLEILIALRLGLYQLRWLNRIPQRAAIHESVELVKRRRKRSAATFVNAVLRKLSLGTSVPPVLDDSSPQAIAESCSHPLWLVERWARHYGLEATRKIAEHNQAVPATAVRLRILATQTNLESEGIFLQPGRLLTSARIVETGDITTVQSFRRGEIVIQDEASQLVAALVGRGTRILDCCAAPGGKTLALADHNPEATVIAVELYSHRARLLRKLAAARSKSIQLIAADAQDLPISVAFDRVLADVPCSGTGTLARNPEIKWRLRPGDLVNLQRRQIAILTSALAQLAPAGRLVYSTCSLEKEENEDVIEQTLTNSHSFRILDCRAELDLLRQTGELTWPDPSSLASGSYLRTIPGMHPCDGFFAAIIERKP